MHKAILAFLASFASLLALGGGGMNIGMRIGAWSGGKPTARSYVQNGLIAMWDGIENAGWGVHDNVNSWVDLIGGINISLSGDYSVGDDCITITGSSGKGRAASSISPLFIETVFASSASTAASNTVVFATDITLKTIGGYQRFNRCAITVANKGMAFGVHQDGFSCDTTNRASYGCLWDSGTEYGVSKNFYNGKEVLDRDVTGTYYYHNNITTVCLSPRTGANHFYGSICSIRCYDRALINAEIAANYAVDKVRFDLS